MIDIICLWPPLIEYFKRRLKPRAELSNNTRVTFSFTLNRQPSQFPSTLQPKGREFTNSLLCKLCKLSAKRVLGTWYSSVKTIPAVGIR